MRDESAGSCLTHSCEHIHQGQDGKDDICLNPKPTPISIHGRNVENTALAKVCKRHVSIQQLAEIHDEYHDHSWNYHSERQT